MGWARPGWISVCAALAAAPLLLAVPSATAGDCTRGTHSSTATSQPASMRAALGTGAALDTGRWLRSGPGAPGAVPPLVDGVRAAAPSPTPCPSDGLANTPLGPTSDDTDNGFGTGKAIAITAAGLALIGGGIVVRRRGHSD